MLNNMNGALVRGKSGLDMPLDSQRYIGTLIIVIDPAAFGEINDFKAATTKLANDLLAVPAVDPAQPVKVPWFRGSERLKKFKEQGFVEIEDKHWEKFSAALEKVKSS